jgi:hypothetical protein
LNDLDAYRFISSLRDLNTRCFSDRTEQHRLLALLECLFRGTKMKILTVSTFSTVAVLILISHQPVRRLGRVIVKESCLLQYLIALLRALSFGRLNVHLFHFY